MAYLARWRVKLGAELLQSTDDSVAEVAANVGYGSEAAFNRAFKRELIVLRHSSAANECCTAGADGAEETSRGVILG